MFSVSFYSHKHTFLQTRRLTVFHWTVVDIIWLLFTSWLWLKWWFGSCWNTVGTNIRHIWFVALLDSHTLLHLSGACIVKRCHKFPGFVRRCQCGVSEGMCVFMHADLHALALCVTVIWCVYVRVKVLGVDTVARLRCHPEECRPFALWPWNMAPEGWVSNHRPWTLASQVSRYFAGCCHKAKGYRGHGCMCVYVWSHSH